MYRKRKRGGKWWWENLNWKQGRGTVKFSISEKDIIGVIDNKASTNSKTEEDVIKNALNH